MDQVLYVLLGFLLSITTITVTDYVRQKKKGRQIWETVVLELIELRFVMSAIAFNMKTSQGALTKEFIDWFQPIAHGQAKSCPLIPEMPPELQKASEAEWEQLFQLLQKSMIKKPNLSLTVNEHSLPFLDSLAADLALLPLKRQRDVWRVKFQLNLFNQQIPFLRGQFDKTFDESLSDVNRERIQTNLNQGYERLGDRAKNIAELVSLAIG